MNQILVPLDGSDCSLRALDEAVDFALNLKTGLVLCHVVDVSRAAVMSGGEPQLIAGCLEEVQAEGKHVVRQAVARVAGRVAVTTRSVEGMPAEQIERLAAEIQPSFIVMGSHGRTGLKRLVMGSVTEGVVRASPVPVMVVPCAHPRPADR